MIPTGEGVPCNPSNQMKPPPKTEKKQENGISKTAAFILDDLLRIPGTNRRIGLDPIIGLIPGVGDLLSSGAGLAVLAVAAKKRVPSTIYLKMISNWALNALVGALPFIGDAFSFWFKSNRRNHELLQAHLKSWDGKKAGGGWGALILLAVIALVILSAVLLLAAWMWKLIFSS